MSEAAVVALPTADRARADLGSLEDMITRKALSDYRVEVEDAIGAVRMLNIGARDDTVYRLLNELKARLIDVNRDRVAAVAIQRFYDRVMALPDAQKSG